MADDNLLNVKKFMDHVVWTPTWISNGHFAVKKARVKLGMHLTSTDAVICAYPNAEVVLPKEEADMDVLLSREGLRVEFRRSPWRHQNAQLFLDDSGNPAWFDADYCDALRVESLFGPAPMFTKKDEVAGPYYDAPTFAEATVVIMPMRVPVDWDVVARTVAAATSLADDAAEALVDIPKPEPAGAEVTKDDEGDLFVETGA